MSIPNVFSSFEKLIPVLEAYKAAVMDTDQQAAQQSATSAQESAFNKWIAEQQPKTPAAPPGVDPAQFQAFLAWQQKQAAPAAATTAPPSAAPTPTPSATPATAPASSNDDVDLDKTYSLLEKIMGANNVPAKVRSKFAERAFAAYKTKVGDNDSSITFDTFKKQFKKPEKRDAPEPSAPAVPSTTAVPALSTSTTQSTTAPPAKKQRVDTASLTNTVLSTVGV